jgi:hypothetical protein
LRLIDRPPEQKIYSEWTATDVVKGQRDISLEYHGGTMISLASKPRKRTLDHDVWSTPLLSIRTDDLSECLAITCRL